MAKTKAHIRYRTSDKRIVPGVTTILGILAKPALVPWANKLGLQGIDVRSFVDDKADIGTLAHAMVTDYLIGKDTDTSDYDAKQIAAAENSALSFFTWMKERPIETIDVETPLVSEAHCFGGTNDIYCTINGSHEIIDLKTGSGIYREALFQVAALKKLREENGYIVDKCRIINIPRSEDEAFIERICTNKELDDGWKIFLNCLSIYNLSKGF